MSYLRHLGRYFVVNLIPSAIFALLMQLGIIPQMLGYVLGCIVVCIAINMVYNVKRCLRHIKRLRNPKKYLFINVSIVLIFASLNVLMAYLNIEPVYTYLYLPYKIGILMGTSKIVSALILNGVMLLTIILAPAIKKRRRK